MHGVDLESGFIFATWTGVNRQRQYGVDVISRIESALQGKAPALKETVRDDLAQGIWEILQKSGCPESLKKICIAGNTAMLHLLMGYDCYGLSRVPFTPVSLEAEKHTLSRLFGMEMPETAVEILPGIAPFVGADITAGIYQCDMDIREELCMLIDIGTNGEIVLGNREGFLCASTAAGPAFEGGNISCGMGSLPGAVQHIHITEKGVQTEMIAGEAARGICGTGVLEAAAELYRAGILDETGRLKEPYFETGFPVAKGENGDIVLTQKDIREIQLAKAALRAGIEALLKERKVTAAAVKKVFLAGGFGFSMNLEKAFFIGLFPEEFAGKIEAAGNSCAAGCMKYLMNMDGSERVSKIKALCQEMELSVSRDFQEFFVSYMEFGQEGNFYK